MKIGVLLFGQTVLLRGVNDDPDTLERIGRFIGRGAILPARLLGRDGAGIADYLADLASASGQVRLQTVYASLMHLPKVRFKKPGK